jgi:putative hydrolase of the HAD superfamily
MALDHTVVDVCPESPKLIHELSGTKILCSNAPDAHINRMLTHLGMADVFDVICDTSKVPYAKPHPQVYMEAVKEHQLDPAKCVMIDDRAVNLKPAHDLGMKTVLIHGESQLLHVDFSYDTLIEFLREAVGEKDAV